MKNPYSNQIEREELILKYLPLVKAIATNIKKHLPEDVDIRDLISYGVIGLIKAVDNLSTENPKRAEAYIKLRIKGAIYDYLRSLDFGSRQVREKERRIKEVVEKLKEKLGREPTDEEVAKELGISTEELFKTLDKINFSYILSLEEVFRDFARDYSELIPSSTNVEEEVIKRELTEKVKEAVSKLPEREKLVIQLIFYEELPAKEVAKILETSVSRVSQLKAKALERLREMLSNPL
ncbi:sigma-70 family RNA polymerase sigma factor [Aquifex aeolicus]|uniref:RNA polymerase sigma factor FliA n=2 Tax=Aquifex aeolicus TaxID=63363 RepID=O67268_AQUAE|nr:FliA/WhiG family RNA polymerase sigma factor [Aquifex aeolicus]AAC07229.1 RNA polymerase sigma factor FliA [Aquifex aeolicus VF5]